MWFLFRGKEHFADSIGSKFVELCCHSEDPILSSVKDIEVKDGDGEGSCGVVVRDHSIVIEQEQKRHTVVVANILTLFQQSECGHEYRCKLDLPE